MGNLSIQRVGCHKLAHGVAVEDDDTEFDLGTMGIPSLGLF